MEWLRELIAHLPTSPPLTPIQGEPGHSPNADWPAPSPPLWDPRAAKRQEASQRREKTPLFLHPTSGDETPDLSPSCEEQNLPQSYPALKWPVGGASLDGVWGDSPPAMGPQPWPSSTVSFSLSASLALLSPRPPS